MKKRLISAMILIGLGSCTPAVPPTAISIPTSIPTVTFLPTLFFTATPTNTLTPTEIPITRTATLEPTPFTSFDKVFISGVSNAGSSIYGNPDDIFHTFTEHPDGFASFHFILQIRAFHFIKNNLTPTPTALPTKKWRILVYRYRTDSIYADQPFVETNFITEVIPYPDKLLMYMTADVSMDAMQTEFGDCSAFAYQVINEQGKVQQQGNFSLNPYLLFASGGRLMGNFSDGVTLGYPYSVNEKEKEFFHQGKFITINEPSSGFYRLNYLFNFTEATGVSATVEQEKLASELTIRFFPYREEGNYSYSDAYPAGGTLQHSAGIYRVQLPIDYLRDNVNSSSKYYLQVVDSNGKIIRDEYFVFIPYIQ